MSLAKDFPNDFAKDIEVNAIAWEDAGVVLPPSDLWSDEPPLETDFHDRQLRFFTPDGELVPMPAESAQAIAEQASMAEARASVAEERASVAEALLARYRQQFGELPNA